MEVYDSLDEQEMLDMIKMEDEEIDYLDGKIKEAEVIESRIQKKEITCRIR